MLCELNGLAVFPKHLRDLLLQLYVSTASKCLLTTPNTGTPSGGKKEAHLKRILFYCFLPRVKPRNQYHYFQLPHFLPIPKFV